MGDGDLESEGRLAPPDCIEVLDATLFIVQVAAVLGLSAMRRLAGPARDRLGEV
jgi:hypothetical protein